VYASRDGVLHIRVTAEQVTAAIDRREYPNVFTYSTELVGQAGTYTPGTASPYIGPRWQVQPGDRLIVDYVNQLPDTLFQRVGEEKAEPIPQPLNLHTHGLTVSPGGNSDNVLLSIPQGRSNRYVIDIPEDQYHGLYWYHPHIHGLADDQVYAGLAGEIVVGRADGDYRELDGLEVRSMMIRYNVVEPNADGNLVDASPFDSRGTALSPRGPMIYTVNGLVAPRIRLNAADPGRGLEAESQVWAFTNVTGSATYVLALEEVDSARATDANVVGRPLDFVIVSEDGTPMPAPLVVPGEAGRGYLLGQGGRVAILVQGPGDPTKVVRLVQVQNRSGTGDASAYNWPAQRYGPGWRDYTRTVLAVSYTDDSVTGKHVDTPTTLTTNYEIAPDGLAAAQVDKRRTFVFGDVLPPSPETPNNFPVDDALFPSNRLDQPRAGTVEEWTILNYSSLHHPFHVHTQYGRVMEIVSPLDPAYRDPPGEYPSVQYVAALAQPVPATHTQDVANVPPALIGPDGMPAMGPDGVPAEPGKVVLRVRFEDFLGTYVEHCHRLPHEDRGMMSLVRTIPHDPVYALAKGPAVEVVGSVEGRKLATLRPFGANGVSGAVAVGDVDGDRIPDVAVVTGFGVPTLVKVYSGASSYERVIRVVRPFGRAELGARVALGDLNADGRDDLIVGQGAGGRPRVAIFDGGSGRRLADFDAYARSLKGGVSVAAGMVVEGGRVSLITGAGPGGAPTVKMFNFDLFGDANGRFPDTRSALVPIEVGSFAGAAPGYRGGVAVATGYPFALDGGFATVLVTTLTGSARLRAFEMMTGHDHGGGVSVSGVMEPHDYRPDAPAHAMLRQTVDLGARPAFRGGAVVAVLSDPDSATVLVAPAQGGTITRWRARKRGGPLVFVGSLDRLASALGAI
jgi:FtsP/CotA-like multicopper oxidase with cupredoxin domain